MENLSLKTIRTKMPYFKNSKHGVKKKTESAHDQYLLDILVLDRELGGDSQIFSRKFLKEPSNLCSTQFTLLEQLLT